MDENSFYDSDDYYDNQEELERIAPMYPDDDYNDKKESYCDLSWDNDSNCSRTECNSNLCLDSNCPRTECNSDLLTQVSLPSKECNSDLLTQVSLLSKDIDELQNLHETVKRLCPRERKFCIESSCEFIHVYSRSISSLMAINECPLFKKFIDLFMDPKTEWYGKFYYEGDYKKFINIIKPELDSWLTPEVLHCIAIILSNSFTDNITIYEMVKERYANDPEKMAYFVCRLISLSKTINIRWQENLIKKLLIICDYEIHGAKLERIWNPKITNY